MILAGQSFAGTIISQAGTDPRIAGLIYIAARGPDAGEDYPALAARFPAAPANARLVYAAGFHALTEHVFLNDFANGVDPARARVMYTVQGCVSEACSTRKPRRQRGGQNHLGMPYHAKTAPYQRTCSGFLARRMHATTIEIDSSHLSMITHPYEVTQLILDAAQAVRS